MRQKKTGENSDAIDSEGRDAATIGGIPSLERIQVEPYGKSRYERLRLLAAMGDGRGRVSFAINK